jgi:hypothetical protein
MMKKQYNIPKKLASSDGYASRQQAVAAMQDFSTADRDEEEDI